MTPPIGVTNGELPGNLPKHGDLRMIGRAALESSDDGGSGFVAKSLGKWSVEARVIRADHQSCVRCHDQREGVGFPVREGGANRSLKVGDAVGVAIYFFNRDRP
jgi:hypothetical protein